MRRAAIVATLMVARWAHADAPAAVDVADLPPLPAPTEEESASASVLAASSVEEDVVVGAAKREQSLGNVASAVTVVSGDRLRRFGYRTVGEAVGAVAGVYLVDNRLSYSIGIRGLQARLGIAEQQVATRRDLLAKVRLLYDKGVAPEYQVHQTEGELAQAEAAVPALQAGLDFLLHAERVVTAKGLDRKYWIDVMYQQQMLRTEISWIHGLLRELRSGELPWDDPQATPSELSNKPKESLGKRS